MMIQHPLAVADPGFPVGGRQPHRGAPTPKAATFQIFFYVKQKNLDPLGGGAAAPPLDPPMFGTYAGLVVDHAAHNV